MSETTVATLIIEASERDSDLLWVSGFRAGDPFVFVEIGGRTHLLLTNLELGRGRKESRVDEVHSWTEAAAAAADALGRPARYGEVVAHFLRGHEIAEVRVPARFPLRIADELREAGISVISAADPLNLGGIITAGPKTPARASNRILILNGVPAARMLGDELELLKGAEQVTSTEAERCLRVVQDFSARANFARGDP